MKGAFLSSKFLSFRQVLDGEFKRDAAATISVAAIVTRNVTWWGTPASVREVLRPNPYTLLQWRALSVILDYARDDDLTDRYQSS